MNYESVLNQVDKLRNLRIWCNYVMSKDDKSVLKTNKELQGKLQGKRCFVVGNAPSLSKQNLSLLENEFVITVNQIARNKDFGKMKTNVHFWADPIFFDEENMTEELLEAMKKVDTEGNHPMVFYPLIAKQFIENHGIDKCLDIHYFSPGYCFHGEYKKDIDFTKMIPGFHTVVDYGIALAIYMGASEIYLLGCDSTGIISYINTVQQENTLEYAYETTQQEKERMQKAMAKHLAEDQFYSWYKVFQQYRLLNKYCQNRNIKMVNCSAGGILNELPRRKFEDVISGK